jgi:hypothetical protein
MSFSVHVCQLATYSTYASVNYAQTHITGFWDNSLALQSSLCIDGGV